MMYGMNVIEAIQQRRSIRKFADTPVPEEIVHKILEAAIEAPSGKNKQPWKFIVVDQQHRDEMIRIMEENVRKVKDTGGDPGSSEHTTKVMAQAPITIFIFNLFAENQGKDHSSGVVDVQSIGAAIQNMLLAALEYSLGTLWICDVFYAYRDLCEWLGETHEMIAAVSIGYPDQVPERRPRRPYEETVRWLAGTKENGETL